MPQRLRILLHTLDMCLATIYTICVLILLCMCPHTTMYVSAGAAALHDTEAEGGPQNKKNPEKLKKENPEKICYYVCVGRCCGPS
jgi:hypothetical protein